MRGFLISNESIHRNANVAPYVNYTRMVVLGDMLVFRGVTMELPWSFHGAVIPKITMQYKFTIVPSKYIIKV